MAKTLYHSELAKLGDVLVTVTTDVQPSKYSKPGAPKPNWVGLRIDGEDRTYNIESDACEQFFAGRKGETLTVQAFGSRDAATIVESGAKQAPEEKKPEPPSPAVAPGRPQASRQPISDQAAFPAQAAPGRGSGGAAAGQPNSAPAAEPDGHAEAKRIIGRAGNLWALAAKALNHQLLILNGNPDTAWIPAAFAGDATAIQAAIATICIQSDRAGAMSKLPCGDSAHGSGKEAA